MTLTIQIPDALEAVLKAKARAIGTSADGYVQNLLDRDLSAALCAEAEGPAFKTGRVSSRSTGRLPRRRTSTPTARRCSRTSPQISDDRLPSLIRTQLCGTCLTIQGFRAPPPISLTRAPLSARRWHS
jgi:hypothetical protein